MTTDLSRALPGSFVIARDTAFTYKGQAADVGRLRRELGVRYVLEGSVLLDRDQVRVNARLIDARSKSGIWADRFDTVRIDIFRAQDEFTLAAIAQNLCRLAKLVARPPPQIAAACVA